jgi:hypothetical protein
LSALIARAGSGITPAVRSSRPEGASLTVRFPRRGVRRTVSAMRESLEESAEAYARVALGNVKREYPHHLSVVLEGPPASLRPRDLHPAFYGSFDWHSCVAMHWVLVRLLMLFPELPATTEAQAVLDEHLSEQRLASELAFFSAPHHQAIERPYGWGWYLMLAHEAAGGPWEHALQPLADLFVARYLEWLPKLDYPQRVGTHLNTAFALTLSLPYAGDELRRTIRESALRWFAQDENCPAAWEPSGTDFLSPALTEAVLMGEVLGAEAFAGWLERFLTGLPAGEPRSLFDPVRVSDATDGQIAHLHGLNLSRAWCFRRLSAAQPDVLAYADAAERHADASLPLVTGSDYMVEHWLAAYAVLLLGR